MYQNGTWSCTSAGNLLKPMLGRGELRCIGATTIAEYRKYIEKVISINHCSKAYTVCRAEHILHWRGAEPASGQISAHDHHLHFCLNKSGHIAL
jgi:hypothetical protein